MHPIDLESTARALKAYEGQQVYVHAEWPRGGFVRNLQTVIEEAWLRGTGPYRVGLRCADGGWVVMEDLTHAEAQAGMPLFICAFGAQEAGQQPDQRLTRVLQLSREPFAP